MQQIIADLQAILDGFPTQLRGIVESEAGVASSPEKWSKKEILGHLIDSASNNHQRFVRAQIVPELVAPKYEQEAWVSVQVYRGESWEALIELWESYNRHILHVMSHVPASKLQTRCTVGDNEPVTLEFLMRDYVDHMRGHLKQLLA